MRRGRKVQEQARSKRRTWLWALLAVLCLGLGLYGLRSFRLWQQHKQMLEAATVLELEIMHMSFRHYPEAYGLYSLRTQRRLKLGDLEELGNSEHFKAFSYYQPGTAVPTRWVLADEPGDKPGDPPIRRAHLEGTLLYQDGQQGLFKGDLELEPGGWRVNQVDIQWPDGKKE